jgi:hypothetical protein
MPDKAPTRRAFLNLSHDQDLPKKILDNRYTDTITSCMLPRRLTLPPRPPAKLNPSLSHSCELFCAPQKVNARQINNFRTLLAKHTGWGGTSIFTRSLCSRHRGRHAVPLSLPPSTSCAYFPSPQGCVYCPAVILSLLVRLRRCIPNGPAGPFRVRRSERANVPPQC